MVAVAPTLRTVTVKSTTAVSATAVSVPIANVQRDVSAKPPVVPKRMSNWLATVPAAVFDMVIIQWNVVPACTPLDGIVIGEPSSDAVFEAPIAWSAVEALLGGSIQFFQMLFS